MTISRKIGIGMAVMISLIAVSAIAANLSMIRMRSTINNLVVKSSPLVEAAYKMDCSKALARFELLNCISEFDKEKLAKIEKKYHKHIADHDAFEIEIGEAIKNIENDAGSIHEIWDDANKTFMPEFDKTAAELIRNHKEHIELKLRRIALMNQQDENLEALFSEIVRLQDTYFNTHKINRSLSRLKNIYAQILLVNDKYQISAEYLNTERRDEIKNKHKEHAEKFANAMQQLQSDAALIYKDDLTDNMQEIFQNLMDSTLAENGLFDIHEKEIQSRRKTNELMAKIHQLGNMDSQMAQKMLGLAKGKFDEAGTQTHAEASLMSRSMLVFFIFAIFISWIIVSVLAHQIVTPVTALSNASMNIARGQNSRNIDHTSSDEIGQLCKSFNEMNRKLIKQVNERRKAEEHTQQVLGMLEEKNRELQNVVYIASHDLKSPLVTINGFSEEVSLLCKEVSSAIEHEPMNENIKNKIIPLLTEGIPQDIEFITAGANKMQMLIGGLLQVSRIGTAAVNIKLLDMDALLKEINNTMQYTIVDKDVKLEIGRLPKCYGDETMINQVFSNLIDNAIKYLDSSRSPLVRVIGWQEKDMSVYCVSDNGIGISEKNQSKIFEIFQRLDPHHSEPGEGLGLAIITRILERHGGKIWVESEPGEGSSFYVSLPAAAAEQVQNV